MTGPRRRSRPRSSSASSPVVPVAIDGRTLTPEPLIAELNRLVGSYGFGRLDMVENRRVGIKSREIYECPGALALLLAHADLEDLTLERDLHHEKPASSRGGRSSSTTGCGSRPSSRPSTPSSPSRSGTSPVRCACALDEGRCWVVGRRSPVSLYDHGLATYDATDTFRHQDAEGFVRLWGLGVATWSAVQEQRGDGGNPAVRPTMTLWHGRLGGSTAEVVMDYSVSLDYDRRAGPRRHRRVTCPRARAWAGAVCCPTSEVAALLATLDQVEAEMDAGTFAFAPRRRGHPHRGRAAGHRDRRRPRGQAAHRPEPERPGRHRPPALRQARAPGDGRRGLVAPGRAGDPGPGGRGHLPARLHPPAAGPAGAAGPPSAGPRVGARPGTWTGWWPPSPGSTSRRSGPGPWPVRPCPLDPDGVADDLGFACPVRELARCRVRPRLRGRGPLRPGPARGPPVADRRGARAVVDRGVRLRRARRRLRHRQLDAAPEEEPRRGRAGPRQERAG